MQVSLSEIKDLTAVLTLIVEPQDYQDEVLKELKQVRQKVQLPGFRVGMVPLSLVKKKYEKGVLAETINKTINKGLDDFYKEHSDVLLQPLANESATKNEELENGNSFTFGFDVAFAPAFELAFSKKDKLEENKISIVESDIDDQIQYFAASYGTREEVEQYAPKDIIYGDIEELRENDAHKAEKVLIDPEAIKDAKQKKMFEKAKVGSEITFNPMKAFDSEVEVRNFLYLTKENEEHLHSDYKLKISTIRRTVPMPVGPELFERVLLNKEVQDEKMFRERVKERLERAYNYDFSLGFTYEVLKLIDKKMEGVQLPEAFVRRYFLESRESVKEEVLNNEMPTILRELRRQLAVNKFTKEQDIQVNIDDVKAYTREEIYHNFMNYGIFFPENQYIEQFVNEQLQKEQARNESMQMALQIKIAAKVKTLCTVEEKVFTIEELRKKNKENAVQ